VVLTYATISSISRYVQIFYVSAFFTCLCVWTNKLTSGALTHALFLRIVVSALSFYVIARGTGRNIDTQYTESFTFSFQCWVLLFVGDLPVVQQGDKDLELLLTYMYP
jgi:hypothetical protein